jgi:hypothetical protein
MCKASDDRRDHVIEQVARVGDDARDVLGGGVDGQRVQAGERRDDERVRALQDRAHQVRPAQRQREAHEAGVAFGAQRLAQVGGAEHARAGDDRQRRDDRAGHQVREGEVAQTAAQPPRRHDRDQQQQRFGQPAHVQVHARDLGAHRRPHHHLHQRRQQHHRRHDRQRRRQARLVPGARQRPRQQRQHDGQDRRRRGRHADAGAERPLRQLRLARRAVRGDEAVLAADRAEGAGARQHLHHRGARLVGAEHRRAEQARDQDVRDRHQPLAERRQQLHHTAAGDMPGVAGRLFHPSHKFNDPGPLRPGGTPSRPAIQERLLAVPAPLAGT